MYENSLEEISEQGFKFSKFRDHSDKCLAGEDTEFVQKYMSTPGTSIFNPVDVKVLIDAERQDP